MRKILGFTLLTLLLTACGNLPAGHAPAVAPTPTETLVPPTATPTLEAAPIIATPLPTQPPFTPIMTPDAIQVERWQEYQTELAKMVLADDDRGVLYEHPELALCEWDLLGRSGQEVYVWAECISHVGMVDARPAVIHLNLDGSIQKVEVPNYHLWNSDFQRLFPADVREKLDAYLQAYYNRSVLPGKIFELEARLTWRQEHPDEPPLVILSAMPTLEVTPITPTIMPTRTPVALLTPDAFQVEHWQEYQTELAKAVLSSNPELGYDPAIYKDALCEWDILGQSGVEMYIYVACIASGKGGVTAPAVIYLESDGSIREVKVPGYKELEYDLDSFPKDMQEKFCFYYFDNPSCNYGMRPRPRRDVLLAHIEYRKTHPEEPPLVILSTEPTATP